MSNEQTPSLLRQLRLSAGVRENGAPRITIRDLERESGINRGRLSILERGVTPTQDETDRIIAALERLRARP